MYAIRSYYDSGELDKKRRDQAMSWMWFLVNEGLERWFYNHEETQKLLPEIKAGVEAGRIAPRITSYNVCYTKLLR